MATPTYPHSCRTSRLLHLHIKKLGWDSQFFMGYLNVTPGQTKPLSPVQIRCRLLQSLHIPGWFLPHSGSPLSALEPPPSVSVWGASSFCLCMGELLPSAFFLLSCLLNSPLLKTTPHVSVSLYLILLKTRGLVFLQSLEPDHFGAWARKGNFIPQTGEYGADLNFKSVLSSQGSLPAPLSLNFLSLSIHSLLPSLCVSNVQGSLQFRETGLLERIGNCSRQ